VIDNSLIYIESAKIITYTALSFVIAMWWGTSLIQVLNWLKFWKKNTRQIATTGEDLVVTKMFYEENEKKRLVPRGGGVLIWATTLLFAGIFWLVLKIEPTSKLSQFLNFVSRGETFIPLGTLFFGSILGLIDDALVTMEHGGNYKAGGLRLSQRLGFVTVFSIAIGLWFHFKVNLHTFSIFNWKLDLSSINLPLDLNGAWLIIPITSIILLATWSTGIIDGFDGLTGGVVIPVYLCFAVLAFSKGFYDVSTLLMVMLGATGAFLWFNIPPAKFFMGDTGTVGLLMTLGVVAITTDFLYVLPIAGLVLFLTSGSAIIQVLSKKIFKRKVFLAAPLHHHFEAMGFARNKITLAYWGVSFVMSCLGLFVGLWFS
jgi:phospho-N-acetylmuramoyl-pentapeptide-transferase